LRLEDIGPGGIVSDLGLHQRAIDSVRDSATALGLGAIGVKASQLAGAEGNQEFFLHARKGSQGLRGEG
jgi:23S rRNA (cytidine1920-2'-O)/16S rRNA (cytidine1409-2'-O)-methyltransferase